MRRSRKRRVRGGGEEHPGASRVIVSNKPPPGLCSQQHQACDPYTWSAGDLCWRLDASPAFLDVTIWFYFVMLSVTSLFDVILLIVL